MINNDSQFLSHESTSAIDTKNTSVSTNKSPQRNKNKFFSLKTKATLLAIALGTLPTIITGFVAYQIADNIIRKEVYRDLRNDTQEMLTEVQRFLKERYEDIEIAAHSPLLTDSELRNSTTREQKSEELANLTRSYIRNNLYESISFLDLQGNEIAVSDDRKLGNHFNDDYFQAVIRTGEPYISQPKFEESVGKKVIYFAQAVRDSTTNEIIGVVRSQMATQNLQDVVNNFGSQYQATYHLADRDNRVFLTNDPEGEDLLTKEHIPLFDESFKTENKMLAFYEPLEQRDVVGTYVPNIFEGQFANLGWDGFILAERSIAYQVQNNFRQVLIIGILIAVILLSIVGIYVANLLVEPILKAASTVEKIGQGDLEQRLKIDRSDEIAILNSNINLMTEQIQNSLQKQKALTEQQRQEKEQLESAIYTLIEEIGDATNGDLTVRANLDSLELSTVADLFNAIIDSLQEIAIEAKQSSSKVGSSLQQNEQEIRKLAEQATNEAKETRDTLKSVAQMAQSIKNVATNASQVEKIADDTYTTVLSSSNNMDSTVDSILNLRTTVNDTANKMQRLAESSQKISQAVSLIEEIALKTNVLAINAGAEADRAGEYGRGFSVIAEQVGALAKQSTTAIKEIARVVSKIQAETQEVRQAMESGKSQVVNTTYLVRNTKRSLTEVLEKSQTIDQLMKSISESTESQADTSQSVTSLMQKIAKLSAITSKSSTEVARSIGATAKVAQKLELAVSQFKVADSAIDNKQL